jgi:hypothetical protein
MTATGSESARPPTLDDQVPILFGATGDLANVLCAST